MRVAQLGLKGVPSKGGVERMVETIVQELQGDHEFTVYCSTHYTPKETLLPGVRLVRVPTLPGKHLRPFSLAILSALHAVLLGRYDVAHVHNAEACFVLPLLRLRYRTVATSHGTAYGRDKWSAAAKTMLKLGDRFYVRYANVCTCVSKPLSAEYKARFGRSVEYVPTVLDDGVSANDEAALTILQGHGVSLGQKYILFAAGRMDPTKGCHFLLEALQTLDTDIDVVVVGDMSTAPAYAQHLRDMADRRVHFIPFVARKDLLLGIVQNAVLFVFPSTLEAMSMMLLEVAALSVPIVCSDIPENVAVLADAALYFQSADVANLKDKLEWALGHPREMSRLAREAQGLVNRRFSRRAVVGQYAQVYRQAMA